MDTQQNKRCSKVLSRHGTEQWMPDFLIILFFVPSVMLTTDCKKWQIFRPICILMKYQPWQKRMRSIDFGSKSYGIIKYLDYIFIFFSLKKLWGTNQEYICANLNNCRADSVSGPKVVCPTKFSWPKYLLFCHDFILLN